MGDFGTMPPADVNSIGRYLQVAQVAEEVGVTIYQFTKVMLWQARPYRQYKRHSAYSFAEHEPSCSMLNGSPEDKMSR